MGRVNINIQLPRNHALLDLLANLMVVGLVLILRRESDRINQQRQNRSVNQTCVQEGCAGGEQDIDSTELQTAFVAEVPAGVPNLRGGLVSCRCCECRHLSDHVRPRHRGASSVTPPNGGD